MNIAIVIPVKSLSGPKKRLSSILSLEQRRRLTAVMLLDVLDAVKATKDVSKVILVSPDKSILEVGKKAGVTPLKESGSKGVNEAVALATNFCISNGEQASLVLPADIPLVTSENLNTIVDLGVEHVVVITPSRCKDGTNALLRRPPNALRTFYDNDSYHNHVLEAERLGLSLAKNFAQEIMLDIDTHEDLSLLMRSRKKCRTLEYLSAIGLSTDC